MLLIILTETMQYYCELLHTPSVDVGVDVYIRACV